MLHATTNPPAAKPARCDDPALTWARLLALTEGPLGLELRAAMRAHVGNILSRLANEAQTQVLAAEAWDEESQRVYDGTEALEFKDKATGRAEAVSWIQGALASVHGMSVVATPFEAPAHWNKLPAEPEEQCDDCPTCGGSGGGADEMRCYECNGTGISRLARAARKLARAEMAADWAMERAKDERAERDFIAQGAELREEGGASC